MLLSLLVMLSLGWLIALAHFMVMLVGGLRPVIPSSFSWSCLALSPGRVVLSLDLVIVSEL